MRRIAPGLFALAVLWFVGAGCGDGFQAGNRLKITGITSDTSLVFNAVEETNDAGLDNQPNTGDEGENNKRPDTGETIVTKLGPDAVTIALANEPRLGVDPGVDLQVFRVDVTWLDANGNAQAFAPKQNLSVSADVPSGGTANLTVVLVP